MKKQIYIEIAGECGVGKSTIAHAIGQILKSNGLDVTILDDAFDDSKFTSENITRNLSYIGNSGVVTIRCKQLIKATL